MVVSGYTVRLLSALIALCGVFALQRADAGVCGGFESRTAIRESGATADAASAGSPTVAAPNAGSHDVAGTRVPAGFDPDPADGCAPGRTWDSQPLASTGHAPCLGRLVPHASARCTARLTRGPPATC